MSSFSYAAALNLFVFMLHLNLTSSQLPPDHITAMTRLYDIFQNNTGLSFVWNNVAKDSDPCSWKGVHCTPDNHSIKNLSFSFFSLSTPEFLPILCKFQTLESLDVSNNDLNSIPDGFFTGCRKTNALKSLNFSRNLLFGSLPDFNGFRALDTLDFSYNFFTGEIVSQLNELNSLRSVNLSHNQFTGRIPTNLGQMYLLQELQLSFNFFTGEIPKQITSYGNLSSIDLSVNKLSGRVPDELGDLTRLQTLVLSVNNLTGEIPTSLFNVTTLLRFAANQNGLNGTIPSWITSSIEFLDLSFNKLTGKIPSDLLYGPGLVSLDLSYNELSGPIPSNISDSLFRLRLGSNSLNGPIPVGPLGNLVRLTYLELDNNSLSGPVPSELGLCRELELLNLGRNRLTGRLPTTLGNLTNLQVLNLHMNGFVGEIPTEITFLTRLQKLIISKNLLNGSIPLSISNLRTLTNLDLQGNNLSGYIPYSIKNLSSLIELQLGKNQLSGQIPDMPQKLQITLNISYNSFSGPVPFTLSRLTELEVLDLSNNRFSGAVPDFLTRLYSLTRLVLSNNDLAGVVPIFQKYVSVDINGNDNLMLISPDEVNPHPSFRRRNKKSFLVDFFIGIFSFSVVGLSILLLVTFVSRRYKRIDDGNIRIEEPTSARQVIHGNILTPNSIHVSKIDFGTTMEAVTDDSNVTLKTRFSTYYKAVMPSGDIYFVKKLNWSDEMFLRSGSHEKFQRELRVLGKLRNSNVMIPLAYVLTVDCGYLIYDFAPEGSLFDVLHREPGGSDRLDWARRYGIAIGVSQGLAFLQDCDSGPILLFDLSSRSILLKTLNEPQVGDIELCKVIDPSKNTSNLSVIAGSVGYLPPEYAYTMRVTSAGNVYSFGVILLELVTGKPAVDEGNELSKWVSMLSNSSEQNKWDLILDSSVSRTSGAVRSQMLAVLKVALACVSISPETRPKMKSVTQMLLDAR